jgi:Tfp pilus assembly protein PilV
MTDRIRSQAGSTLIEVLIATLVLVSGVLAMAQLFLAAAATNAAARQTTVTATIAAQTIEQILSTEMAVAPETVDHVDGSGHVRGRDPDPPPEAVYTRRWSIDTLTPDTLLIRVRVGRSDRSGRQGRMAGDTQVLTIRRRRQP